MGTFGLMMIMTENTYAGKYHAYTCRTPSGEVAPADGWSGSTTGGPYSYDENTCAKGGALVAALGDEARHSTNTGVTWALTVPTPETLVGATLWRAGDNAGGGHAPAQYGFWLTGPTETSYIETCIWTLACENKGNQAEPLAAGNRVEVPVEHLGSHLYTADYCNGISEAECEAGKGDKNGYASVIYLYAADLVLEQNEGPTVREVSGPLATEKPVHGTSDITFNAADPGAGVYEAVFTVDGKVEQTTVINENGGHCKNVVGTKDGLAAFLYLQPCLRSVSADVGFDTTKLSNGKHHLIVTATDAAGNSATVLDREVESHNARCEAAQGAGSSLQNIAQHEVWIKGFDAPGNAWETSICEEEKVSPIVTYFPTSSGRGLAQWGANGTHALKAEELENEKGEKTKIFPAYVGTDVAPEGPSTTAGTQLREMDEAGDQGTATGEGIVAVPVAQSAVSVLFQIPKACLGTLKEGEVVSVTSERLEREWLANNVDWSGLLKGTAAGAETKCTTEKAPTLYGRFSASGTTAAFKRFVGDLESGANKITWAPFIGTAVKSESASEWPKMPVEEACKTKLERGQQLAEAVGGCEAANGVVGYADLADARKAGFEKEARLIKPPGREYYIAIARVQNNAFGSAVPTYQSPEKATELGESNCKKAFYFKQNYHEVKGNEDWSGVKQQNLEQGESEAYPICTLTFSLAWHVYEAVPAPTAGNYTEQKADTVFAYLHYIINEGQESSELKIQHYGRLPTTVEESARRGLINTNNSERSIRWKKN